MEFKHPNYYKKLRANRQQATGNRPRADKQQAIQETVPHNDIEEAAGPGRVGPRVTSLKKNKTLDRSGDMGYSRNSDQGSDRATRPGMEPAVNSTVKIPGSG